MLLRFETIAFQRPNVALFDTPCKTHGEVDEIFQSIFRAIIYTLSRHGLNFRYVEPFRNQSINQARVMGEMSAWMFRTKPRT